MTITSANQTVRSNKKPHEYGRPQTIEDASNRYLIHPLSDLVVKGAMKVGVSPNFVSFLGLACGFLAGILYYQLPQPGYVFSAFLLMVAWHVFDGADGRLARATGKTSAFGRIIDGICDHLVFGFVYIALALHLIETGYSLSVWWLVVGAGVSHAIQAAGYEERRQKYQRRLEGVGRNQAQDSLLVVNGKKSFWAGLYDMGQKLVAGGDYGLDGRLDELRRDNPSQADAIVQKTASMVRAWGILNANNRTLLIFLAALLGQPALYYFAFELIVLNFVLLLLIYAERQQETMLLLESHES